MATIATTYQTYQAKGIREDLSDIIYDISPVDTPFMSNGGRESAKNTLFEWQTDALAAVDTANAQIEGDDITQFPAAAPTVRVGNYTQISRKLVLVSGTLDVVDKAGRATELAYQLAKRSSELKRDMESMALEAINGAAGDATTARTSAGLPNWTKTNSARGVGGADPIYTSGVPAATPVVDGTTAAITEAMLKDVASQIWDSGGTLKMAMAGPVNKQNISTFSGIATRTYFTTAAEAVPVIGAVDVYVTDFGSISIVPNRFQRERDVWLLDPDFYSFSFLRPFFQESLAKTGDADKRMLIAEWGLRVKNEAALGVIADLNDTVQ